MAYFFQNPANNLMDFSNLEVNESILINEEYILRHPKTFITKVGKITTDCTVHCRFRTEIGSSLWIRIYQIIP